MENEKSAVDKFLEGTNTNMFEEVVTDPFETPVEEPVVEEVEEEKPLPFHKDPKVLKFIEKEIAKRTPQREETIETKKEEEDDLVSAFTNIIGNDTPEKVHALKMLSKTIDGIREEASSAKRELEAERIADQEAEQELESAFESIEETFDVDFDRNPKLRSEFVTFVEKIAPKDRQGNIVDYPDMLSAYETFNEMKSATRQPNRAKELASRSLARSSETTTVQPKRIDWNSVEDMMDNLK